VPWGEFDLIVANGAWDNIHRPAEFLAWVDAVAATTPLVNSPATLRWNLDKRYLAVLADHGVATVPTTWLAPGVEFALPPGEIVVKPTISGGGFQTARYGADELDVARAHVRRLLEAGRTVMIQPYQSAVDAQGETGLIFLGGRYSHAISKGPLLRIGAGPQDHLWADEKIGAATPTGPQLETATAALAAAEHLFGPTTYARVDLLTRTDGTPALLELELLDPALFFETDPAAATRFAEVLAAQIQRSDQLPSG
jgi:glutathione synthase/RimK-type ligase-like ATP-grasp enzyme